MTRLRYRLAEMVIFPIGLVIVDGLFHLIDGKPFMSQFVWGAVMGSFILRGVDASRAASGKWPEQTL